jgi:hypothetical protein
MRQYAVFNSQFSAKKGKCEFREEKMTQGWVVYGGKRHAEPQREIFSRSYEFIIT